MSNKSSSDLSYFPNIYVPDFSLSPPLLRQVQPSSAFPRWLKSPSHLLVFPFRFDISRLVDTVIVLKYESDAIMLLLGPWQSVTLKVWVMDQNKACEDIYCLVPLFWPLNTMGLTYIVTYLSLGSLRYHCLASRSPYETDGIVCPSVCNK